MGLLTGVRRCGLAGGRKSLFLTSGESWDGLLGRGYGFSPGVVVFTGHLEREPARYALSTLFIALEHVLCPAVREVLSRDGS